VSFELVEFREPPVVPGEPIQPTQVTVIATYDTEPPAIEHGRLAWREGRQSATSDVHWWIVRTPGENLARWIADASSSEEQVLDLRTNRLVRVVDGPAE
jgi:hypothetical protein